MSELEHAMEHAAHAGEDGHGDAHGHGGSLGRSVGMSMAGLGMLLALCSALVGSKRTELIAAMVAQTNTSGQYHALSAKHRVIQAQLQQLHARMPDRKDYDATEAKLVALAAQAPAGPCRSAVEAVRLQERNVLETVMPTQVDLDRFAWLVMKYADQTEAAREWTESYDAIVEAHREAADRFEIAQLCAEIGIVLASIAMLFRSKKVFWLSVLAGVAGAAIVAVTWYDTTVRLHEAEQRTVTAERRFVSLSSEAADEAADEELVKEIEESR